MADYKVKEPVMPLTDQIRELRERTLSNLDSAHDYYADTKIAYLLVGEIVAGGEALEFKNDVTSGAELDEKSRRYVDVYLTEATFLLFLSLFESFVFDLLRAWLTAYPQGLGGKKLDFRTVLEAADKDAITEQVVSREVHEITFERPAGWFAYLEARANLDCPSPDQIARIAEAKATRDVLVHAQGVVGPTYLAKAGAQARSPLGDRIEVPGPYHRSTWNLLREVVAEVADAAAVRAA